MAIIYYENPKLNDYRYHSGVQSTTQKKQSCMILVLISDQLSGHEASETS